MLEWGPAASATSDSLGAYSLNTLPDGTYQLKMDQPSPSHHFSTPSPDGRAFITISGGMSSGTVNFGIYFSTEGTGFHNFVNALDVDADTFISPSDAVLVINWLNANPDASELPADGNSEGIGYVDVDNDGFCTTNDAILVINYLNAQSPRGGVEVAVAAAVKARATMFKEVQKGKPLAAWSLLQAAAESEGEQANGRARRGMPPSISPRIRSTSRRFRAPTCRAVAPSA